MKKEKKILQCVSLTKELRDKIIEISEIEQRSIANTIVTLCLEGLKSREANVLSQN